MHNTLFSLAGSFTLLFSNSVSTPLSERDLIQLEAHLPGIEVLENSIPADLIVTHIEQDDFAFSQTDKEISINEQWSEKLSPDFVHIIYGATRIYWLERGLFPSHSACVGSQEKGYILLVGQSGAGKTTTALQCAKEKGLKIYSGDKTLLHVEDDLTLASLARIKVISIRAEDQGRWNEMIESTVATPSRLYARLKKEYVAEEDHIKIKGIALIQLNEGHEYFQLLSPLSALHTLYPFFMDVERADVVLGEGKALLDGAISPEVKRKEIPRIAESLKKIPTYRLTGSLKFVTQKITEML